MSYERMSVLDLTAADLEKLNDKQCPKCGADLTDIVKFSGVPQVWYCHYCRIEYSTTR